MIIEGILTTRNSDGSVHISAMGPKVESHWHQLVLRPFKGTRTWENLKREPFAVFHVTDDIELLVRAALGDFDGLPPLRAAVRVPGYVLTGACRWYELRIVGCDETQDRVTFQAEVVHEGRLKEFCGWNRAQFAIIEAAITATRLHLLPADSVHRDLQQWQILVNKTGGEAEQKAMQMVRACIENWLAGKGGNGPNRN